MEKLLLITILFFAVACQSSHRYVVKLYSHNRLMVDGPYTADSVKFISPQELKLYVYGDSISLSIPEGTTTSIVDEWERVR